MFFSLRLGAVGVHEKSELKKILCGINYVSSKGSYRIFFNWFSWRPFLLFLFFWAIKRKERGWIEKDSYQ